MRDHDEHQPSPFGPSAEAPIRPRSSPAWTVTIAALAAGVLWAPFARGDSCLFDLTRETRDPRVLYEVSVGHDGDGIVVCLGRGGTAGLTRPRVVGSVAADGACVTATTSRRASGGGSFESVVVETTSSAVVLRDIPEGTSCEDPFAISYAATSGRVALSSLSNLPSADDALPVSMYNSTTDSSVNLSLELGEEPGAGIESTTTCSIGSATYALYGAVVAGSTPMTDYYIVCDIISDDILCVDVAPSDSGEYLRIWGNDSVNVIYSPTVRTFCAYTLSQNWYVDPWYSGWDGYVIISGYDDDDILIGAANGDRIYGGDGDDIIYGGEGDDYLEGNTGEDYLSGQDGDDTLRGQSACCSTETDSNTLVGGDGADVLYGADGDDTFEGGPGNDTMHVEDGVDTCNGGTGLNTCPWCDYPTDCFD